VEFRMSIANLPMPREMISVWLGRWRVRKEVVRLPKNAQCWILWNLALLFVTRPRRHYTQPCVELCKALRWNMKFRLIPPRNFVDKRILRHRLLEWFMESETQIPHPGMMWMDTKKKGAGRRCVVSTWKDTCRSSVGRRDDRPG
jgi:hypothetical protein